MFATFCVPTWCFNPRPRKEATLRNGLNCYYWFVSIHAPVRRRRNGLEVVKTFTEFQSTPP